MENTCFRHPDIETDKTCYYCGRPFCKNCLRKENNHDFCGSDGCKLALMLDKKKNQQTEHTATTPVLIQSSIIVRFIHYIIDLSIFYFILYISFSQFLPLNISNIEEIKPREYILFYTFLFLYYFIFEFFFQKTPAKFITGCKVVTNNGNKPGLLKIALRSLLRLIPFEILTYYKGTWLHDRLSKTQVVSIVPIQIQNSDDNE